MGIQGLSKYIYDSINVFSTRLFLPEQEGGLLSPHSFVVDGYSLIYHLYAETKALEYISGGEYYQFACIMAHFLRDLLTHLQAWHTQSSTTQPLIHIVLEGSASQSKATTWHLRMQKKIVKACMLWRNKTIMKNAFFLPPFAIDVAAAVMKQFAAVYPKEVKLLWAPGEADELIAHLASLHNAYILSSDSDFMLHTGNAAGFCALPFMKWQKVYEGDEPGSLSFAVLTRVDIAKRLHIPVECLPMIAVLAGNDHFTGDFITEFHESLQENFKGRMKLIQRIAKYIREAAKGMPSQKDPSALDEYLLRVYGEAFKNGNLAKRALNIHHSYQMDCISRNATRSSSSLYSGEEQNHHCNGDSPQTPTHQSHSCSCLWSRELNHIYFDKKYLPFQPIEDFQNESIQEYLGPMRKRLYTWMFFNEQSTFKDDCTTVTEYYRKNTTAAKVTVQVQRDDFATMFSAQLIEAYKKAFPEQPALCNLLVIFKFPPQFVQEVLDAGLSLSCVALFIALWILQERWSDKSRAHIETILLMFCSKRKELRPVEWKHFVSSQMPYDAENLPSVTAKQFEYMPEAFDFLTALRTISLVNAYFGFPLCRAGPKLERAYCLTNLMMHYSGQAFKMTRPRVDKSPHFVKETLRSLPPWNKKMVDLGPKVMKAAARVQSMKQNEGSS